MLPNLVLARVRQVGNDGFRPVRNCAHGFPHYEKLEKGGVLLGVAAVEHLDVLAAAFLEAVHEDMRFLVGEVAELYVGRVDVGAVLAHHQVVWLIVGRGNLGRNRLELGRLLCALRCLRDHKLDLGF